MKLLAALAALLGIEVDQLLERLRRDAVLYGVVAALTLVGIVFLLVAANAALTLLWGPVYAPLALGGGALLIALVVWGIANAQRARNAKRERERKRSSETAAAMTTAAVAALPLLVGSPAVRRWGIPLAGAAAALWLVLRGQGGGDDGASPPKA